MCQLIGDGRTNFAATLLACVVTEERGEGSSSLSLSHFLERKETPSRLIVKEKVNNSRFHWVFSFFLVFCLSSHFLALLPFLWLAHLFLQYWPWVWVRSMKWKGGNGCANIMSSDHFFFLSFCRRQLEPPPTNNTRFFTTLEPVLSPETCKKKKEITYDNNNQWWNKLDWPSLENIYISRQLSRSPVKRG